MKFNKIIYGFLRYIENNGFAVVYYCSSLLVLSFHVICYLVLCLSIFVANMYQCSTVQRENKWCQK